MSVALLGGIIGKVVKFLFDFIVEHYKRKKEYEKEVLDGLYKLSEGLTRDLDIPSIYKITIFQFLRC